MNIGLDFKTALLPFVSIINLSKFFNRFKLSLFKKNRTEVSMENDEGIVFTI